MEGRHDLNSFEFIKIPSQSSHVQIALDEEISSDFSEGDDDPGPNPVNLLQQKRRALFNLFSVGNPVIRRPALNHIGNVDIFPFKIHDIDDFCQKLPCPTHKRTALEVFIPAWCLTNKHEVSSLVSFTRDSLCPLLREGTSSTLENSFPKRELRKFTLFPGSVEILETKVLKEMNSLLEIIEDFFDFFSQ